MGKLQWWAVMLWRHRQGDNWIQSYVHHGPEHTPLDLAERELFQRGYDSVAEMEEAYKRAGPLIRVAVNSPKLWRLAFVQAVDRPKFEKKLKTVDIPFNILDENY